MKKLFYSLSLALICGLAANAAQPTMKAQKLNASNATDVELIDAITPMTMKFTPKKNVKAQKGKVATTEDFLGEYMWAGDNNLAGVVWPNSGDMNITVDPDYPDSVLITGFAPFDMRGKVENGRLYIPNQFTYLNTHYNEDCWFWNYTLQNGTRNDTLSDGTIQQVATYKFLKNDTEKFYFSRDEQSGMIFAGNMMGLDNDKWRNFLYTDQELRDLICIASCIMPADLSGYFWLCSFIQGEPVYPLEVNLEEWLELEDDGEFKDAWFPNFWQDHDTPAYPVKMYRNKANSNLFMLGQPYGDDTPYGGDPDFMVGDGAYYIQFHIGYPDCVWFQPLVASVEVNLAEYDGDGNKIEDHWTTLYNFNHEGYSVYVGGESPEDLAAYYIKNFLPVSTFYPSYIADCKAMDIAPYYPDIDGPVVEIFNGCFGETGAIASTYGWVQSIDEQDGTPVFYDLEGYIILPSNYDDPNVYVKEVGVDNNATPEYYNLQGVRVSNPEKGQLVIVKKGNQTMKVIK